MEAFQYPESNQVKQIEAGRKRLNSSGRLSPRALFGNLKCKKPFLSEEDTNAKDTPNNKISWKPPLKVEYTNSEPSFYHESSSYMFGNSSQNCDVSLHPKEQPLNDNSPNDLECNKTSCSKENDLAENQGEYNREFTGNLDETIRYEECSNKKVLSQHEHSNSLEEPKSCDVSLDDSINEESGIHAKRESPIGKVNFEYAENNTDMSPSLTEKRILLDDNSSVLMEEILQFSNNSLKEFVEKSIHNFCDSQPKDGETLYQEDFSKHEQKKTPENDKGPLESDDFSGSIDEMNDNSKISIKQTYLENKDEIKQDQDKFETGNEAVYDEQIKTIHYDSFDAGITNSQFLQLESQLEGRNKDIELIESNVAHLNNSLDSIKRCSSSLAVQTDWQKNILRNMIKDIDELNKTVLEATASMKSARKCNFPAK